MTPEQAMPDELIPPGSFDDLRAAISRFEAGCKANRGYMPAIPTVLRLFADEMADKYPDDTNGGRAAQS
jgi:hypothetical protein